MRAGSLQDMLPPKFRHLSKVVKKVKKQLQKASIHLEENS